MFKCVKELILDMYDDDNEIIENDHWIVVKGSEWLIDDYEYKENDIRLINDNGEWIEIDRDTFKEYFKEVVAS